MVSDRGARAAPLRDQACRQGVSEVVQAGVRSCAVALDAVREPAKRRMDRMCGQGLSLPPDKEAIRGMRSETRTTVSGKRSHGRRVQRQCAFRTELRSRNPQGTGANIQVTAPQS